MTRFKPVCPEMCPKLVDLMENVVSHLVEAVVSTYQVPLLVPHGIVEQLVHRTVPAVPEGRSLVAPLFVLLLCPQHLHRHTQTFSAVFKDKELPHRQENPDCMGHLPDHPPTAAW